MSKVTSFRQVQLDETDNAHAEVPQRPAPDLVALGALVDTLVRHRLVDNCVLVVLRPVEATASPGGVEVATYRPAEAARATPARRRP